MEEKGKERNKMITKEEIHRILNTKKKKRINSSKIFWFHISIKT